MLFNEEHDKINNTFYIFLSNKQQEYPSNIRHIEYLKEIRYIRYVAAFNSKNSDYLYYILNTYVISSS